MKAGGSVKPSSAETVANKEHYVYQEGQAVFKFAVKGMADVSAELLERNKLTGDDIAWLVPHQANKRIIDATASRMGLPQEKVMLNIQRYGNTTAGTIPLCLWEWRQQLNKGDNIEPGSYRGNSPVGGLLRELRHLLQEDASRPRSCPRSTQSSLGIDSVPIKIVSSSYCAQLAASRRGQ
jgi:3-oxoacyl-[acyl-carrier-protein] synthase-3